MAGTSTTESPRAGEVAYASSIYFAHSCIDCDLDRAWELLLDYQSWNPGLVTAVVTAVSGQRRSEGELVLIKPLDDLGRPLPAMYAETVRIVPRCCIVWFVYPQEGDSFQSFLEFSLTALAVGVRFDISWYSRDRLCGEALLANRAVIQGSAQNLTLAFKGYCETAAKKGS